MPEYVGVATKQFNVVSNQTANRALNTAYQNTNQNPMGVSVTITANAANGSTIYAQIGTSSANASMANVSGEQAPAANICSIQMMVPPGAWYQIVANTGATAPTLSIWAEIV